MPDYPLPDLRADDVVLDLIPDDVEASVRVRNEWLRSMRAAAAGGLEFIFEDMSRWTPGQTVRVAFLDGDAALHKDIAEATQEITAAASLVLDFGLDPVTGRGRAWTEADTEYAAEIRVSFDKPGFFSLVGTATTRRSGPAGSADAPTSAASTWAGSPRSARRTGRVW